MHLFAIIWGHPAPALLTATGLLLALLFTGIMVWLFTRNFTPELKQTVERPKEPSEKDE